MIFDTQVMGCGIQAVAPVRRLQHPFDSGQQWRKPRLAPVYLPEKFVTHANHWRIDAQVIAQSIVSPPFKGTTVSPPMGNSAGKVQRSRVRVIVPWLRGRL